MITHHSSLVPLSNGGGRNASWQLALPGTQFFGSAEYGPVILAIADS
jgi:hypothetical protein